MKHKSLEEHVAEQRAKDTKAWQKQANAVIRELNSVMEKLAP